MLLADSFNFGLGLWERVSEPGAERADVLPELIAPHELGVIWTR